jgi:cellulose synthase (UDP-forming)
MNASTVEKLDPQRFITRRETGLTWVGISFTLVATFMVARDFLGLLWGDAVAKDWGALAIHLLVAAIIAILVYGGLVYQFARLAFIRRLRAHCLSVLPDTEVLYQSTAPSVCVLVPSYMEERAVVEMTLLSAALQDYPSRHVVLLIDDPPQPKSAEDAIQLDAVRKLPAEIEALFDAPRHEMLRAQASYWQRCVHGGLDDGQGEYQRLSENYKAAGAWFQNRIDGYLIEDHAGDFFVDKVLRRQQISLLQRAQELQNLSRVPIEDAAVSNARCEREYNRLVGLFSVHLSCFERKRYLNLSHEPNKAMNLNSYLGLMGKRFREVQIDGGQMLQESQEGNINAPWADYVITLDADSLLLTGYAKRLVHLMEQPENQRIAVVQTPYSAFPNTPTVLERIAGATTDIQYIIHQGFEGYGATFWVGANALLRRESLEDIVESDLERGFPIQRYIQDRTVIEDTESTIDLIVKGWQLHNYPERLAYSATPPDFGSLLIQRRRWANGGLLILPKLIRHLVGQTKSTPSFGEGFMRLHYLVSIAAVNAGLLILLAFPVTSDIESLWLPLTAVPYFFLYGRDLMHLGYSLSDLLRVYALNLLLIPINLGGVLMSIKQAILKTKIPFGRTPKVQGRTAAPALYVFAEFVLVSQWLIGTGFDVAEERWPHALFALVNAMLLGYAIVRFIGFTECCQDMRTLFDRRGLRIPLATPPLTEVPDSRPQVARHNAEQEKESIQL